MDCRYRVDVAIPDALLAVEINGWANHGKSLRGFRSDHERTRALLLAGWRIVPFTHREALQDTERCVEIVLQLVSQGSGKTGDQEMNLTNATMTPTATTIMPPSLITRRCSRSFRDVTMSSLVTRS